MPKLPGETNFIRASVITKGQSFSFSGANELNQFIKKKPRYIESITITETMTLEQYNKIYGANA